MKEGGDCYVAYGKSATESLLGGRGATAGNLLRRRTARHPAGHGRGDAAQRAAGFPGETRTGRGSDYHRSAGHARGGSAGGYRGRRTGTRGGYGGGGGMGRAV